MAHSNRICYLIQNNCKVYISLIIQVIDTILRFVTLGIVTIEIVVMGWLCSSGIHLPLNASWLLPIFSIFEHLILPFSLNSCQGSWEQTWIFQILNFSTFKSSITTVKKSWLQNAILKVSLVKASRMRLTDGIVKRLVVVVAETHQSWHSSPVLVKPRILGYFLLCTLATTIPSQCPS